MQQWSRLWWWRCNRNAVIEVQAGDPALRVRAEEVWQWRQSTQGYE